MIGGIGACMASLLITRPLVTLTNGRSASESLLTASVDKFGATPLGPGVEVRTTPLGPGVEVGSTPLGPGFACVHTYKTNGRKVVFSLEGFGTRLPYPLPYCNYAPMTCASMPSCVLHNENAS